MTTTLAPIGGIVTLSSASSRYSTLSSVTSLHDGSTPCVICPCTVVTPLLGSSLGPGGLTVDVGAPGVPDGAGDGPVATLLVRLPGLVLPGAALFVPLGFAHPARTPIPSTAMHAVAM